jgi:hypothetical protein
MWWRINNHKSVPPTCASYQAMQKNGLEYPHVVPGGPIRKMYVTRWYYLSRLQPPYFMEALNEVARASLRD